MQYNETFFTNAESTMSSSQRIPVHNFFRNPERVGYTLSPDGENLAFLAPVNGRLNVHVQNIATSELQCLSDQSVRNIAGLTWANNTSILYIRDVGGDENWQLFVASIDGQRTECLTPFPGVQCRIVDLLKDNDQEILISLNQRDRSCFDVYRCNIQSAELSLVAQNPGSITAWLTDHVGKLRVAVSSDGVNHRILYRDSEGEEFQVLLETDFRVSVSPICFSYDNSKLIMLSNEGRNTEAIVLYDPLTRSYGDVLFEHPDYDISRLARSDKRKRVLGAHYWAARKETLFADDEFRQMIELIERKLPGQNIDVVDVSRDETVYVIEASDPRNPASYYIYSASDQSLKHIADARPWLKCEDLCIVEPVRYQSRDGLSIHGFLTLPNNTEASQLPVVMFIHGGPWARDVWDFNPTVQFYASRGYAVMQLNFRGSTGYGRAFWEASFKQWGRSMQNDISDAVAWLIASGVADPKRVAIAGGSYGGYAVLAGLAFTPDLYCCGIDIVGVSNLFTFRQTIPEYWKQANDMLDEMIGSTTTEADMLREVSPYFHAQNIRVPLLVFQGAKDPRVNIAESDQIVEALKANGVEVEYIVKAEEGHGFMNEENRLEMMEIIEKFLEKHLS